MTVNGKLYIAFDKIPFRKQLDSTGPVFQAEQAVEE